MGRPDGYLIGSAACLMGEFGKLLFSLSPTPAALTVNKYVQRASKETPQRT
jgi:hypothetical protein